MNITFDSKVAVVTGAASGIGFSCTELLLTSGAKVALVDCQQDNLAEAMRRAQGQGIARGYQLDVADIPAIAPTVEQIRRDLGEIDVLVCSAGINIRNLAVDVSEVEWDTVVSVNTKGLFFCNQAVAIQSMIPRKTGAIVNIASVYGLVAGAPKRVTYCASKGGVVQLTRQEAIEWAPYNIRVNAIAPAFVLTNMTKDALEDQKFKTYVLDNMPLRHLVTVQDVAAATAFLASDVARMITGVVLPVDGGWTAR